MPSRSLDDLHPIFQPYARAFVAACRVDGLEVLVYCTRRTMEEQAELYAQGRTKPGRIVTHARPGQSAHNYGLALDAVPMLAGKPQWQTSSPLWQQFGRLARAAGCEWAGDWKRFREFPHVQMTSWKDYR